jgi:radical SAM protein with 4Fe4S-binding SPASM domain
MVEEVEHRFFDPNIPRKGRLLDEHVESSRDGDAGPPFFSLIEFNLSGLCNRKCVFCPRVNPKVFPNVNEHIPIVLYEKIIRELAEVNYDGMILYSAFGEPLLYKNIEMVLELSKRYCSRVRIETVTDGDFVTPSKLRSLFGAGLDTLLISMYDGPYQVELFEGMMAEAGLSDTQVVLRRRWLPPEEHYGITLSNRAGMVEIPEVGVGPLKEPLKRPCFYPFYQILIDYDGAVLLCPHDWGKKLILGNLHRQSLMEVWDGRIMRRARLNLAKADRNFSPCDRCNVDGTLMGQGHFDRWMEYYKERGAATGV